MPLAILAIAGALGWWSTHAAARRQREVHDLVAAICDDTFNGRDPAARLRATEQLVRRRLAARLREVVDGADGAPRRLAIDVVEGDAFMAPATAPRATHTATLRADGAVVLGLRILHEGDAAEIAIIGFWTPPPPRSSEPTTSTMQIWLNGKFVNRDAALVSAFDAGLQHGIGLFETCVARNGTVFRATAHARRLVESATALLLSDVLRVEPLAKAMQTAVEHNELDEARIRLTVTGGDLGLTAALQRRRIDPTILVDVQPPTVYPDAFFEDGVLVTIAEGRLNPTTPMAGHKTLNYWPRIHALQKAGAAKAGESLWFTVTNHLAGGSVSNVFVVMDGVLATPCARGEQPADAVGPAVLPGITRAAILELADAMGLETRRCTLDINQLLSADEVFLTNSSWGVLPVVAVEKNTIGDGRVGDVTTRLRDAWLELVQRETT